jgi:SAM-dependent methyltransferase
VAPPPSAWVARFADRVPRGGRVLDLACGGGRHARLFLGRGHPVTLLDRDTSGVADLAGRPGVEVLEADLEDGRPFPLAGRSFAGVVVTNYLHRPILPDLVAAVAPGGALIYETFAQGNEAFGKPSNPAFLLAPGELLDAVRGRLRVLAYEDRTVTHPRPSVVQRICAVRGADPGV